MRLALHAVIAGALFFGSLAIVLRWGQKWEDAALAVIAGAGALLFCLDLLA